MVRGERADVLDAKEKGMIENREGRTEDQGARFEKEEMKEKEGKEKEREECREGRARRPKRDGTVKWQNRTRVWNFPHALDFGTSSSYYCYYYSPLFTLDK